MSFTSRLISWLMHLPPAHTHDIVITRDITIPMPDGVVLLADHYAPRSGRPLPTLLVRSPYGRRGLYSAFFALPYAERGYQVLIQSCRGTAGSGGQFLYARHEHDDGLATIAWIKQQDWFSGELATIGASYLGFVQWAVAADAGPDWKPIDWSQRLAEVKAPVYLMAGWYDFFLDWQLKDYQALRRAGKQPSLLVGPWTHPSAGLNGMLIRETLAWLDTQVKGKQGRMHELPVHLFVMGENTWRHFADWPPPARSEQWYLQANGKLDPTPPCASEPDRYRYDPADPTPAVGGNSMGARKRMGPQDNRSLEARSDVLVYTSAELSHDLEVIGPVKAEVYVRSSLQYTDFFVRLCVVKPSGRSINLCDGIVRLTPGSVPPKPDGSLRLCIDLWPTAYHFRRGERLRVQVSSGAHPRFARNLGSGQPLATGTKLCVASQTVYHDPEHPSAILLPVLAARSE